MTATGHLDILTATGHLDILTATGTIQTILVLGRFALAPNFGAISLFVYNTWRPTLAFYIGVMSPNLHNMYAHKNGLLWLTCSMDVLLKLARSAVCGSAPPEREHLGREKATHRKHASSQLVHGKSTKTSTRRLPAAASPAEIAVVLVGSPASLRGVLLM